MNPFKKIAVGLVAMLISVSAFAFTQYNLPYAGFNGSWKGNAVAAAQTIPNYWSSSRSLSGSELSISNDGIWCLRDGTVSVFADVTYRRTRATTQADLNKGRRWRPRIGFRVHVDTAKGGHKVVGQERHNAMSTTGLEARMVVNSTVQCKKFQRVKFFTQGATPADKYDRQKYHPRSSWRVKAATMRIRML